MLCEDIEISTEATEHTKIKLDLPQGVPPLTSLYLYISGSCNLACHHCWINPSFNNDVDGGKYVKLSYVKKAIKEAKPLGLQSVKLTGGEPIIHPNFKDIVSFINDQGLNIMIETNGTLIDKNLSKFIKEKKSITFISVSLDGATSETHDTLRGVPGSHKQALNGIRYLVEAGIRPQLICTLHRGNVSEISDIITLAEKLGCQSVKFNHVQQVGRGETFARQYGLKIDEIIDLYNNIEREIMSACQIPIFFSIPFAFYSIKKLLGGRLSRCTVFNILGMLSSGELSLCGIGVTVPDLIFGHISEKTVKDVWYNSTGLKMLREQIPNKLEGICSQCLHRNICVGTCVANNYFRTGKLNAPYYFCEQAEALDLFPESRKRVININEKIEGGVA